MAAGTPILVDDDRDDAMIRVPNRTRLETNPDLRVVLARSWCLCDHTRLIMRASLHRQMSDRTSMRPSSDSLQSDGKTAVLRKKMSAATLDIYGCVRYLFQTDHQGVRDYLVNYLHEFSVSEIEQVLFQLW